MTDPDLPLVHVSRPPEDPPDDGGPSADGDSRAGDDRPSDGERGAPAVLLLHGRGADERDLLPIGDALPDELHVLSARAPDPLQGGYTWYELDLSGGGLHQSQPHAEQFRRSLDLVEEFVDQAVDAYGLDPDRLGLLGFSQGAITSLSALLERPDRYAWVVALNGYLAAAHDDPELFEGAASTPVFLGAGEGDRVIPVQRAERAAERLREGGLDVTFETYRVGHGTTPSEVQDVAAWVAERLGE